MNKLYRKCAILATFSVFTISPAFGWVIWGNPNITIDVSGPPGLDSAEAEDGTLTWTDCSDVVVRVDTDPHTVDLLGGWTESVPHAACAVRVEFDQPLSASGTNASGSYQIEVSAIDVDLTPDEPEVELSYTTLTGTVADPLFIRVD